MSKTDLTKLNEVTNFTAACECVSNVVEWVKTEAEKSQETECERLQKQDEILKNEKLSSEDKKYYFNENNKTYLRAKIIDYSGKIGFVTAISFGLYFTYRTLSLIKPID